MTEYSFHFDCGNSSEGPIGLCARVRAEDEKTALSRLQDFLAANVEVNLKKHSSVEGDEAIEYCNVYIEPSNIGLKDIDESEEVEDAEDDRDA